MQTQREFTNEIHKTMYSIIHNTWICINAPLQLHILDIYVTSHNSELFLIIDVRCSICQSMCLGKVLQARIDKVLREYHKTGPKTLE